MSVRPAQRVSAAALASVFVALTLTGCGMNGSGSSSSPIASPGGALVLKPTNFTGFVHGGQQAVTGAVVTLWAAGTSTGYGKGATAIASTTTDALGNFSLNPATVTNITSYAIVSNVATFTTSSAGSYTTGTTVVLGGFPTSTFLNGQEVVVTAATPTSFTAAFPSANAAATEAGSATYYLSTISPCTAGQYNYLTAVGGNPGLGGTYGTTSVSTLAMMSALPAACVPATNGASYVSINEVSTAASVTALQQFLSISSSGKEPTLTSQATPPWTIGAPSTNLTGLANAFAATADLFTLATGATTSSNSSPFVVASTVGGTAYTMQVQPDAVKLNTFADVLATCFNQSATLCGSFLSDATPGSSPTPIDTVQAAYYLASNPAGLTMPAHGLASAPYWLCYNYVTATAPFQPTETCSATTPTFYDWTMGVKFKLYNGATNLSLTATTIAVDSGGHIWTGGNTGYGTVSPLNEFSLTGQFLYSGPTSVNLAAETLNYNQTSLTYPMSYAGQTGIPIATATATYTRLDGVAIDTTGNVWASIFAPTLTTTTLTGTNGSTTNTINTGLVLEVPPSSASGVSNAVLVPGAPSALAFDSSNNLFIADGPFTSKYYSSALLASGGYTTLNEGGGTRSSSLYQASAVDQNGNGMSFSSTTTGCAALVIPRNTATGDAALALTPSTAAPAITLTNQCADYGAVDTLNNLWITGTAGSAGATAAQLVYLDLQNGPATPIQTAIVPGIGGLGTPAGVAIDGLGNIWVANGTSGSSGLSEYTAGVLTVGTGSDTLTTTTGTTVLSPAVTGGFDLSFAFGTLKGTVIDGSGNLWLEVSGSSIGLVLGAAAPVLTPIAAQLTKTAGTAGSIGNRP